MVKEKIFVTGCCGYIGKNVCYHLMKSRYCIVGIDNFSSSCFSEKIKLERIAQQLNVSFDFYEGNVNYDIINKIFLEHHIFAVIHCAGKKSIKESINLPLEYYTNNLISTIEILKAMEENKITNFIFSSSAVVYGNSIPPYNENSEMGRGLDNPYAKSKYFSDEILKDFSSKNKVVSLKYFNPIGSGIFNFENVNNEIESIILADSVEGENVFPTLFRKWKNNENFEIFGNDYTSPDGSPIRDFLHIDDLSIAHVKSVDFLLKNNSIENYNSFNLGTGTGVSVLSLVQKFNYIISKMEISKINYIFKERRRGDLPVSISDTSKTFSFLNWKCKFSLDDMVMSGIKGFL